jgi:hypothetical protein
MCSHKNRSGNHQLEQRVTEHDATSGNAGYGLVTAPKPKVQTDSTAMLSQTQALRRDANHGIGIAIRA